MANDQCWEKSISTHKYQKFSMFEQTGYELTERTQILEVSVIVSYIYFLADLYLSNTMS